MFPCCQQLYVHALNIVSTNAYGIIQVVSAWVTVLYDMMSLPDRLGTNLSILAGIIVTHSSKY